MQHVSAALLLPACSEGGVGGCRQPLLAPAGVFFAHVHIESWQREGQQGAASSGDGGGGTATERGRAGNASWCSVIARRQMSCALAVNPKYYYAPTCAALSFWCARQNSLVLLRCCEVLGHAGQQCTDHIRPCTRCQSPIYPPATTLLARRRCGLRPPCQSPRVCAGPFPGASIPPAAQPTPQRAHFCKQRSAPQFSAKPGVNVPVPNMTNTMMACLLILVAVAGHGADGWLRGAAAGACSEVAGGRSSGPAICGRRSRLPPPPNTHARHAASVPALHTAESPRLPDGPAPGDDSVIIASGELS